MKTINKRDLRFFKIAGIIVGVGIVIYLMLSIFAPNLLQRLGSGLQRKMGTRGTVSISIATAERGGHYYRLGNLLKSEMEKHQGRVLDVRVTRGTLDNLDLIRKGDVDFALIQGAVREDEDVNFRGLGAIATIGCQYVHILTPVNSSIREFKDLVGKRVSLGSEKSGNAALGRLVFGYFPSSSSARLVFTPMETMIEDFSSGKIDAFFAAYDLNAPLIRDLMDTGSYRLVPIHEAEAAAYAIPGCSAAVLPHSLYGSNRDIPSPDDSPFHTLKVDTLLVTREEMSRYEVENMLRTLYSTGFIKRSGLPELNEQSGRKVFDLPLHPAADRFYRRGDPVTADKYEIGSAFLAALLFIATVISYFINRYRARRLAQKKKNIVPYFEELLQFGKKMADGDDIEQLKKVLEGMMSMQRRAEKEWLEGNLDTEHMENLYAIYGIRCENAFNKMTLLQLIKNQSSMEQLRSLLHREERQENANEKKE